MDAKDTGEHHLTLDEVVGEIMGAVQAALAKNRVTVLTEAIGAIIAAAPPLNSELLYDGREDPRAAAYVEGFKDAWSAVEQLLPREPHPLATEVDEFLG